MSQAAGAKQRGDEAGRSGLALKAAVVVAALGQLVVLVPFTVASGLVAPAWAVAAFHVLWVGCTAVMLGLARRRPIATPLVPLINAALLFGAMAAGDAWLGWTA
jgi:hypothetical protein